ncbi:T9SS type A sorting domain-containing protein [Saccharicrinis sp. FJH2]|uniref:pectate lyase family protein n=1 Tax=Saccharicrinis sp. FJH65 TaxID=3344659 RepID=UPI0035F365FF
MKQFLHYYFLIITLFSLQNIFAQDKPDGFAAVSGLGLETTTGGEGGEVVIADTYAKFNTYARSSRPYIILVKGVLESTSWQEIDVNSNKTIIGYGTNATLKNMELHIINKQNIIIRNLIIRDSYVEGDWDGKTNDNDAIQADNSHHMWIDHCFFTNCGDGLIDLRHSTDYATISYNKLTHHNKAFGIGWITDGVDNPDFHLTIHHNWIDSTNQRNPSFDMGIGHLYNNYLSRVFSYGNQARGTGRIIVQNSVFENVNDPLTISSPGIMYEDGNLLINCSGDQNGNASVYPYDLDSYYSYTLDPTDQVKEIVTSQAGPQQYISDQYHATAIDEVSASKDQVKYYVDQHSKTLYLESQNSVDAQVRIYSSSGRMIYSGNLDISHQESLPLKGYTPGIYLVRIESSGNFKTGKFILN